MENKEIKINVPEGYEIDKENSTFEIIKFKKKKLTYDDIENYLYKNRAKSFSFTQYDGNYLNCYCNNNDTTKRIEIENKFVALIKLINVATYLNDGWKPNFKDDSNKYYISWICDDYCIDNIRKNECFNTIYFKSYQTARQAIEILGVETIKNAII